MRLDGLLVAIGLVLPGCSFIFVRPPLNSETGPAQQPGMVVEQKNDCTESVAAPVLDVVGAVGWSVLGAVSIWLATDPQVEGANKSLLVPLAIGSLVTAAVEAASAVYGFSVTGRCRAVGRPGPLAPQAFPSPTGTPATSPGVCVERGDAPLRCSGLAFGDFDSPASPLTVRRHMP